LRYGGEQLSTNFPEFVFEFVKKKYKTQELQKQNIGNLLSSVESYKKGSLEVN